MAKSDSMSNSIIMHHRRAIRMHRMERFGKKFIISVDGMNGKFISLLWEVVPKKKLFETRKKIILCHLESRKQLARVKIIMKLVILHEELCKEN